MKLFIAIIISAVYGSYFGYAVYAEWGWIGTLAGIPGFLIMGAGAAAIMELLSE